MSQNIDYPKLLQALKNLQVITPLIRPDEALRQIKTLNLRSFDSLIHECKDLQETVERAAEDCQAAVESPIYIGVVGHYSHGKSSLLNALLFPPKTPETLPTGEGVVTSLCTLLQFSNATDDHEFYEVSGAGEEHYLPANEYRARVAGKGKGAGTTSHFKMRLHVPQLSDPALFNEFAEKQIELLDTPGLGGPYWKDEKALMTWIKEFVMVVVCIKASEINETTAVTVNPFLKQTTKPLVPVITFWDLWRKSRDFKGIADEAKARAEAKKRISQYFPSLAEYVDDTVFTSAKACIDATQVPKADAIYFTDDWNVDNVRSSLANQVQSKGQILRTQKAKDSPLDFQRRTQVKQLAIKLCSESGRITKGLRERIIENLPKGKHEELVALFTDELQNERDHRIEVITMQIDKHLQKAIPLIKDAKSWGAEFAKIKEAVDLKYAESKNTAIQQISKWFNTFKLTRIDPYVKETGLKEEHIKHLDSDIKNYLHELLKRHQNQVEAPEIVKIPNIAFDIAKGLLQAVGRGFKQMLVSNAPLAIILAIAGPTIFALGGFVSSMVPALGGALIAAGLVYVFAIMIVFWSHCRQALKKSLLNGQLKALEENSSAKIADRIDADFGSAISEFAAKVTTSIETQLAPLDEAARMVLENLLRDLNRLDDSISDVRQLI